MGKHPQDRFRRLAIVSPTGSKARQQPGAAQRWWGTTPESQQAMEEKEQFRTLRMAVMPTFSRGMWIEAMLWAKEFVRSHFLIGMERPKGGIVLPFRSHAARAQSFRLVMTEEEFVSKKANGSVRWNSEREIAPQEGGRG